MDEIEKRLMSLSDDEKIERLEYERDYRYTKILAMSLQSDKLKLQMIDKLDEYDKIKLVKSLQSDGLKMDYIRNTKQTDRIKADIAKSMKSDDLKIQALSLVEDDNDSVKSSVIKTMQSDEKKIETMKQHIKPLNYDEVILSLSSTESIIANLDLLASPYRKQEVLKNIEIENDEQRLSIVASLKDDYLASGYIKEIEDEKKKIEALHLLNGDPAKVDIIKTLESDDEKIKLLEELSDDFAKADVIVTLESDDEKIKLLEELSNDSAKADVIVTLESDNEKIKLLEELSDDSAKVDVIKTLESDDEKIKLLENFGDNFSKIDIIEAIQSEDRETLKEKFLDKNITYKQIGLDPTMTIGMEIESEGNVSMSTLLQVLQKVIAKQVEGETKDWEAKGDASLEEGVEIVSPILTDNKEDVEDIYIVCSMLQRCENIISDRCGGHIHIGADYLKSKDAYVNLFEIWGNAEEIIYKMSNEIGTIPRMGLQEFAPPISPKLNEAIEKETINLESEEDLDQFIAEVQKAQDSRYSGLNLLNINNGKNTVEFRVSNGTINPDTWIENARLYGRMMQVSQKLAEIEKQPEQGKEDKKLLELWNQLKEEIPEQEKMEVLLELLFSEEERKVYRERYISCSELLEQIPDEKNPLKDAEFSRVYFKKKKHNLDEFHDVAVNDRIEDIDEVTRETVHGVRTEGELEQANNKDMEEK